MVQTGVGSTSKEQNSQPTFFILQISSLLYQIFLVRLLLMFHINSGAAPKTLPNFKYDAPREVCGDRNKFYHTLEQIWDVNRSWALALCLLNSGHFHLLPLDISAHILYLQLVL